MEWTATRSGKHAVVGYNGRGDALYNNPASGFDVIADQIACHRRTSISKKRFPGGGGNGGDNPPGFECSPLSHCTICNERMDEYKDQKEKVMEARDALSPCPPSISQAVGDNRFIKQPSTNCYVSTFPKEFTDLIGNSYTITKQCCYIR